MGHDVTCVVWREYESYSFYCEYISNLAGGDDKLILGSALIAVFELWEIFEIACYKTIWIT